MTTGSALGYQMMYEGAFIDAARNASAQGNYRDACAYAKSAAIFMGVENIPDMPIDENTLAGLKTWRKTYFDLLNAIAKQGNANLIKVRKDYRGGMPT